MQVIETFESNVRSYSRSFPTVFSKAEGTILYTREGRPYIDFFAGAGALNYGHNHPVLKEGLLAYIQADGVTHALDMATDAKSRFLEHLVKRILVPRGLSFRVMFPGPAGTNAVEAALKLARKVTGRSRIVAFANAFHGMSLGSMAVSGGSAVATPPEAPTQYTQVLPFPGTTERDPIELLLESLAEGDDLPAAILIETTQAEGGVNVAPPAWLRRLAQLARDHGILLIVDDIQVGCGRTGRFFSFEEAGLTPDIICLSKSLSGYGLPLALTLLRADLDVWRPGEHNGTFRGNNHAFVTGALALSHFWSDEVFVNQVRESSHRVSLRLRHIAGRFPCQIRGLGMIFGLELPDGAARKVSVEAFRRGLLIETCGDGGHVLKLLPPLTTPIAMLEEGLSIIEASIESVLEHERPGR